MGIEKMSNTLQRCQGAYNGVTYTRMIPRSYGAAMGGMMVTKDLGRCGCTWSYDGVEGSVVVART